MCPHFNSYIKPSKCEESKLNVQNMLAKKQWLSFYIQHPIFVNGLNAHKSGGVVIPDGLGVPKGLQSRIRLDDLILQGTL